MMRKATCISRLSIIVLVIVPTEELPRYVFGKRKSGWFAEHRPTHQQRRMVIEGIGPHPPD
jgi:hypothetical protein